MNCDPYEQNINGRVDTRVPCSHPEADTLIFLDLKYAVDNDHRRELLKSVNSNIYVLAVGLFGEMAPIEKLYVEYGTSKALQILTIHNIVQCLGPKSEALAISHSLS